jgi:hypothetical protein
VDPDSSRFDQTYERLLGAAAAAMSLAALGGMYMFIRHVRRRSIAGLVLGHGLFAFAAYVTLILALWIAPNP